jgi:hypothetical protein
MTSTAVASHTSKRDLKATERQKMEPVVQKCERGEDLYVFVALCTSVCACL